MENSEKHEGEVYADLVVAIENEKNSNPKRIQSSICRL